MSRSHSAIAALVLGCLAAAILLLGRAGAIDPSRKKGRSQTASIEWEDKGPTPLGEKGYTPQGMTWVDGNIIFANTWKDQRSRVYEINPRNMTTQRYFDMPEGAVHTSGLAWDGEFLWAVDYKSNKAYCIDLEPSLENQAATVVGSFESTLRGTSACCIVPWNGRSYLAISDFMKSRRTIFVRHDEAMAAETAEGFIDFSYRNNGFSQGLEFAEGYLYEAENRIGKDIINRIDLEQLRRSKNSRKATVLRFQTAASGIEDLAWSGEALWTSDENVFRFHRGVFQE